MNSKLLSLLVIFLIVCLGHPVSANAYDTLVVSMTPGVPILTTNDSTNVEETTATLNGYLLSDGGAVCQYRFEYDTDSGVPYAVATVWAGAINSGTAFSQPVAALTKGELYFFRAQCRNVNGGNSAGERRFLTKPDGVTNFQAVRDQVVTQVNLTWTNGDGADKSVIVKKVGAYPADRSDGTTIYNGTSSSYEDGAVVHGTHYFYRIWSYCSESGLHRYSDDFDEDSIVALAPATFDIRDIAVPDNIIEDLTVTVIVENQGGILADITVSWVLKRVDNNVVLDMGSDTFAVAPFSLVVYTVTPSTAYIGQVMITFMGDGASASEMFATSGAPPSGGGAMPAPPIPAPPAPAPLAVPPVALAGLEWPCLVLVLIFVLFFIFFLIIWYRKREKEKKRKRRRKTKK